MSRGADDDLPGVPGNYHGRPTRRVHGSACWIEVLSRGGPRIVGFGLKGGPNVLAETPDAGWDSGHGRYEVLGGHRFWFAPESAECSVPDSTGLIMEAIGIEAGAGATDAPLGLRLIGAVEAPTGLHKEIEVRLDASAAGVTVRHTLRNDGARTFELSPWPITQLRLGGTAFVALPVPGQKHGVKPGHAMALWHYASWSDARLRLGDGLFTVEATPGPPFKMGCLVPWGAIAYLLEGVLFVKRFDPAFGSVHADMGCNIEIYADEGSIELESLGVLTALAPGDSVAHVEHWELHEVGAGATPADLIGRFGLR
jgi:hypothetical protein